MKGSRVGYTQSTTRGSLVEESVDLVGHKYSKGSMVTGVHGAHQETTLESGETLLLERLFHEGDDALVIGASLLENGHQAIKGHGEGTRSGTTKEGSSKGFHVVQLLVLSGLEALEELVVLADDDETRTPIKRSLEDHGGHSLGDNTPSLFTDSVGQDLGRKLHFSEKAGLDLSLGASSGGTLGETLVDTGTGEEDGRHEDTLDSTSTESRHKVRSGLAHLEVVLTHTQEVGARSSDDGTLGHSEHETPRPEASPESRQTLLQHVAHDFRVWKRRTLLLLQGLQTKGK